MKAGDHYKIYIQPALETLDQADLGVQIGPINSGVSCVADDVLLTSDSQTKLQSLLDIASHYGKIYRVQYGASKTKITITGSEIDSSYFQEARPWKMDGEVIDVVCDNDHLGQIVSGGQQEQKNIDSRISKARKSLFSLLGVGLDSKSLLSPAVKLHLYRTYTSPILRSGLQIFALRKNQIEPLSLFQRKTIKSFLRLFKCAPTPSVYFLSGELPVEAKIHRDMFNIFYCLWTNPNTKVNQIVRHCLQTSYLLYKLFQSEKFDYTFLRVLGSLVVF